MSSRVWRGINRKIFFMCNAIFPPYDRFRLGNRIKNIIATQFMEHVGSSCNWGKVTYIENKISIGNYSGIGNHAFIQEPVQIGDYVMMAQNVKIYRKNHNMLRTDIPMCQQGYSEAKKLTIEDDVWIGDSVIILPGVEKIGKGSVLGAYSVITKDVEPYSVMGGNPAKVIKKRK